MKFLLILVAVFGVIFGAVVLQAWVATILWGWFLVPYFGAPSLTVPVALGIMIILTALRGSHDSRLHTIYERVTAKDTAQQKKEKLWTQVGVPLIAPLIQLAYGYIYKLFL